MLRKKIIALLVLLAVACVLALAVIDAARAASCGIPAGETCSTDTECECLHGIQE